MIRRAKNMDPGVECEFRINTRSPPPLLIFRRGPQKLSSGSHKDGWGSAACSTFLTVDWWRGFLWQVSVLLQASTSGTGRIAPWREVCSKVMIVTSSLSLSLSCACTRAPSDGSATDRLHKKKGSLQGDEMRPSLGTKWNSEHVSHNVKSVWKSPAAWVTDTARRRIVWLL